MPDSRKLTKNEKRRLREKEAASKAREESAAAKHTAEVQKTQRKGTTKRPSRFREQEIEVEYVSADVDNVISESLGDDSDAADAFKDIFSKFAKPEELMTASANSGSSRNQNSNKDNNAKDIYIDVDIDGEDMSMGIDDEDMETDGGADLKGLSKRQLRRLVRPTVAQLKQMVNRPEVVEAHDVTAPDPMLLITLKAYRNTVPVPIHWSHRKKYLSSKRGVEKPPFQLPAFIADTGIDRIRQSLLEAEENKKSKAKARSQVRPSMGKVDIDYQVLHDAFFKYQTKPELTRHGELYYEGKEVELGNRNKKAGEPLSETLLVALGIDTKNSSHVPPPWLTAQQRYGPPPSYPNLKIPGLSAPIPPGCQFGYGPNGWGRPPVDEYGRPLYGDVFGIGIGIDEGEDIVDVGTLWGEIQPTFDDSDDDMSDVDSEDDDDMPQQATMTQIMAPPPGTKVNKQTGHSAVMTSEELKQLAEQTIDLRKRSDVSADSSTSQSFAKDPTELFTEVRERAVTSTAKGELFASDRTYELGASGENIMKKEGNVKQEQEVEDQPKAKKKRVTNTAIDNFKF